MKTTVNIDEETLKEFKNMVTSRFGSSRKLSQAIEDSMKNYNTVSTLLEYSKREKILIGSIPSSKEIMDRRPVVDGSAGDELRAMRDERALSISR